MDDVTAVLTVGAILAALYTWGRELLARAVPKISGGEKPKRGSQWVTFLVSFAFFLAGSVVSVYSTDIRAWLDKQMPFGEQTVPADDMKQPIE